MRGIGDRVLGPEEGDDWARVSPALISNECVSEPS